jgi:hypothetical protein
MNVDLNNERSIAKWFRLNPKRHGPQLAAMARLWPQFAEAIRKAGEMLRNGTKR